MTEHSEQTKKWYNSEGFVYFIGAGEPVTAIKIGVTVQDKIKQRLKSHQTSNHMALKILGVIPTKSMVEAEKLENLLHIKFSQQQRFKHRTSGYEWFTASKELLNEIKNNAKNPSDFKVQDSIAKIEVGYKLNTHK